MDASSVVQARRERLLKLLRRAAGPLLTSHLSKRLGWSIQTTRAHLHALEEQGLVMRFNYRRWLPASPTAPEPPHADPV